MNKSEEYLDSLLNNVSPERIAKAEQKRQKRVVDFGAEFESELNDTATVSYTHLRAHET